MGRFDTYDMQKLKSARDELQKVLEYYYGHSPTKRLWRRLDTIVIKLNELIEMNEKGEGRHND